MLIKYIIITPAYNEAKYITDTIESVLRQTILPLRWIIVDDGSVDGTADIIKKYASKHDFITYHWREKKASQSYFASNVFAIMSGWEIVKNDQSDFLAILDADITLPEDYYQRIFTCFGQDQKLGIASGIYKEKINGQFCRVISDRRSTPKAIQVFRRECFEMVGGYIPLEYGGEDTCSCIMARMNGWKTWSFPEISVLHNKPVGRDGCKGIIKARFKSGLNDYYLASHPLFFTAKIARLCLIEKPFMLSGLARMSGFIFGSLQRKRRDIPYEVIKFTRREQLGRLFKMNRIPEDIKVKIKPNV